MIATSRQSASRAIVPPICKGLWHSLPTHSFLRRAARVNPYNSSTGAFSLVDQHCNEHRPSRIVNGLRQHAAGKSLHVQIFDGNQSVPVVAPLIPNGNVRPLEQPHGFAATVATLLSPRHLPLSASQPRFRIPVVPGVLNSSTVREYGEAVQPDINSNFGGAHRQRRGKPIHAEDCEPPARFALDRNCLDCAFEGPVQLDLDVPSALDAQLAIVEQSASVSIGRKGN